METAWMEPAIMIPFRATPIPTATVEMMRRRGVDSFGNVLTRRIAESCPGTPCRHCLNDIAAGEAYYVIAYSAFTNVGPYCEVGPIFLHAEPCAAFDPRLNRIPDIVRIRTVAIRGYTSEHEIARADIAEGAEAEQLIESLLAEPAIAYLHARTARYGCYLCRIDRA
jgi:Protein of unknown function (DUF1203)